MHKNILHTHTMLPKPPVTAHGSSPAAPACRAAHLDVVNTIRFFTRRRSAGYTAVCAEQPPSVKPTPAAVSQACRVHAETTKGITRQLQTIQHRPAASLLWSTC